MQARAFFTAGKSLNTVFSSAFSVCNRLDAGFLLEYSAEIFCIVKADHIAYSADGKACAHKQLLCAVNTDIKQIITVVFACFLLKNTAYIA